MGVTLLPEGPVYYNKTVGIFAILSLYRKIIAASLALENLSLQKGNAFCIGVTVLPEGLILKRNFEIEYFTICCLHYFEKIRVKLV